MVTAISKGSLVFSSSIGFGFPLCRPPKITKITKIKKIKKIIKTQKTQKSKNQKQKKTQKTKKTQKSKKSKKIKKITKFKIDDPVLLQSRTIQLQVFHQQNFIWMWADFFSLHFSSHPPGYPLISYIL